MMILSTICSFYHIGCHTELFGYNIDNIIDVEVLLFSAIRAQLTENDVMGVFC
ncbi:MULTISPECIES: hypothetical protein [unclassified Colwellia]|uniref:hypothetical protein n=1 Tax=unclassified Colwellia TaxID=196834 RepID=UPI0015F46286|nr:MULTISPECIES: hypothetical protein [unclassified Colwellia]MBA6230887.1 hypothetical protein [Colwellia sp. MB02u-7]MBA6234818.1 hypothetical protein [Colwellia sp. MB02u-11]MBA6255681.1 hypothetical protein [Colwellia sp. MB3u-28]MBA6261822.1 hypothetical protein [Colwellia sp. MB3u-41]MBA6301373.1 hypothetical protein [Colwellia sp. MB3u-22]